MLTKKIENAHLRKQYKTWCIKKQYSCETCSRNNNLNPIQYGQGPKRPLLPVFPQ